MSGILTCGICGTELHMGGDDVSCRRCDSGAADPKHFMVPSQDLQRLLHKALEESSERVCEGFMVGGE